MKICLFIKTIKNKILNHTATAVLVIMAAFCTKNCCTSNNLPKFSPIVRESDNLGHDIKDFHDNVSYIIKKSFKAIEDIIKAKKKNPNEKLSDELTKITLLEKQHTTLLTLLNNINKTKEIQKNYKDDIFEAEKTNELVVKPLLKCVRNLSMTNNLQDVQKILFQMIQISDTNEEYFLNQHTKAQTDGLPPKHILNYLDYLVKSFSCYYTISFYKNRY